VAGRPVAGRPGPCRPRRLAGDDTGVTLVELMVSMTVMSVVTLMFVTAVMYIYRSTTRTEAMSVAQSQINNVFGRLEREIRYAAAMKHQPGHQSMEYLTVTDVTQVCTQLWVTDARLKRRTWTERPNNPAPINRTAWTVVASQVGHPAPFTVLEPEETRPYQRLQVRLEAAVAGRDGPVRRLTDVTFTAVNTTPTIDASGVCNKGRQLP
jgi:prepilin-type N-terminal cleavage/methylation domain-containing protein